MRGSRSACVLLPLFFGIIPAHAGLTVTSTAARTPVWDHPRACGAHNSIRRVISSSRGSSPRMRGSQLRFSVHKRLVGIIPAHAGLTGEGVADGLHSWDHPRACGAHLLPRRTRARSAGSSPRMRGSRARPAQGIPRGGIIPAHAGLTRRSNPKRIGRRDHPRACGAHVFSSPADIGGWGSSPRMRGSHHSGKTIDAYKGIIPAHAGLTVQPFSIVFANRDHPRACGAHCCTPFSSLIVLGSSPRMRGSPLHRSQ